MPIHSLGLLHRFIVKTLTFDGHFILVLLESKGKMTKENSIFSFQQIILVWHTSEIMNAAKFI